MFTMGKGRIPLLSPMQITWVTRYELLFPKIVMPIFVTHKS